MGSPILSLIKARLGFDRFLPLQEEVIGNVLAGKNSLVLLPTGGGKSLRFEGLASVASARQQV